MECLFFFSLRFYFSSILIGVTIILKGVATLLEIGTLNFKASLTLSTIATFASSGCPWFFAGTPIKKFSGKGLLPDEIIQSADFVLAITLARRYYRFISYAVWVSNFYNTWLGGALVGGGLVSVGTGINFSKLGNTFFLPLLMSPIIAVIMSSLF